MKLNKGDIVEIIEKDDYNGLTYEVGTRWVVTEDHPNNYVINVHDVRQVNGKGLLGSTRIKKVKLPKQNYKFEVGQIYKVLVKGSTAPFSYDKFYTVQPSNWYNDNYIFSDDGIKYYANDFGDDDLNTSNTFLELVMDSKEPTPDPKASVKEPIIEVQFLLDYIEKETLNYREIIAFLKGYLKGERFKND